MPGTAQPGSWYVYVIAKSGDGPIKAGFATNPKKRVQGLETMNGHRFRLIWISDQTARFKAIEKLLHQHMRPMRLVGEWFDVPFDLAITIAKDVSTGRKRSRTRFSTGA